MHARCPKMTLTSGLRLLQRWDLERYYAPEAAGGITMYARLAAFVPHVDEFDAGLFRCSSPTSCDFA